MKLSERVAELMKGRKVQLHPWQIDWLAELVAPLNSGDKRILEVGTGTGTSLLTMVLTAPDAWYTTIDIVDRSPIVALAQPWCKHRIAAYTGPSTEYVKYISAGYDFIFIDADHRHTGLDLPWFNHLHPGGTILFHDYSDAEVWVRNAVDALGMSLGRTPDLKRVYDGIGMAGYTRREGERWLTIAPQAT